MYQSSKKNFVARTDLTTFENQVLSAVKIGQPAAFACLLSFFRQTKQYNVALLIYQMLQSLACVRPTAKQNQKTHQQAQALVERLETTVRKVLEALRMAAGVGVTWYFSPCRFFPHWKTSGGCRNILGWSIEGIEEHTLTKVNSPSPRIRPWKIANQIKQQD